MADTTIINSTTQGKEYRVLVTGFGANVHAPHGNSTSNPSGEVALIMPSRFSADNMLNVSDVEIKILTDIKPEWLCLDAAYGAARSAVQGLYEQYGDDVDLWVHLGRMGGNFYGIERRAYSQDFTSSWTQQTKGYYQVLDNEYKIANDNGPNPWTGKAPMGLHTEVNVSKVAAEADQVYKKYFSSRTDAEKILQIRSHVEAGPALCGFIFYESLAQCFVARKKLHVLFCHVPPQVDKEIIERGRDAILAIIGASIADIILEAAKPPREGWPTDTIAKYFEEQ